MPNNPPKSGHLVTLVNYLVIASLIIIFAVLLFIVVLRLKDPVLHSITTPPAAPTTTSDPVVSSWEPYENTTYNFSIEVPAGWNRQDYSAFLNNGGTLIAFSPDELPCSTCSYLNSGYFSITIYNQKTDPALYNLFVEKVQKANNGANYPRITLDGKTGLISENTVSIQNGDWVYDITIDKNDGNDPIENSQIMKHVLTSFKFTSLFNPEQPSALQNPKQ